MTLSVKNLRRALPVAAVAATMGLTGWILVAQQPRPVDDNALKNAAKNGAEWLTLRA